MGAWALCFWGLRENRKLFINYGTAIFALPDRRIQFWLASNGRDMVFASHDTSAQPAPGEMAQAQAIIDGMFLRRS